MELADYQVEVKKGYGKRLSDVIDMTGMKAAKVARVTHIHTSTLSRIASEKQAMGDDVIDAIVLCFDVNREWLESGMGEMGSAVLTAEGRDRMLAEESTNFSQYGQGNSANYKSTVSESPAEYIRMEEENKYLKKLLADKEEYISILKSLIPDKKN